MGFRSYIAIFLSCFCLLACDSAVPVGLGQQPDARPVTDLGPPEDMNPMDAASMDMTPPEDAQVQDAQVVDAEFLPDFYVEVPNEEVPPVQHFKVLGGGDESVLVWWRGGKLLAQRVSARISEREDSTLAPIEPSQVSMELGDIKHVAWTDAFDGQIYGGRSSSASPALSGWALIANGNDGAIRAYNTAHGIGDPQWAEPLELALYPPIIAIGRGDIAGAPDQVLVVGRTGIDSNDPIGLQTIDGHTLSEVHIPSRGWSMPIDATPISGQWVFAFEDGTCVTTETESFTEIGFWRCFSGPGARLIGKGPMSAGGPALWMAGQVGDEVVAWEVRPGVAHDPGPVGSPAAEAIEDPDAEEHEDAAEAMEDTPEDAENEDAGTLDAGVDDGSIEDASIEVPEDPEPVSPPALELDTEQQGGRIILAGAQSQLEGMVHRSPSGAVLSVKDSDGQRALYLLEEDRIRALSPGRPDSALGAITATADAPFLVTWDPQSGQPAIRGFSAEGMTDDGETAIYDGPSPPDVSTLVCANRLPEQCGETDHDCSNASVNGVCCPQDAVGWSDHEIPSNGSLQEPWFVAQTDEGAIGTFRYEDRVELRSLSDGTSQCRACWPDISRVENMAHHGRVTVIHGFISNEPSEEPTCLGECNCGGPCARCVFDALPELLAQYRAENRRTSCQTFGALFDEWCTAQPEACEATQNAQCAEACGLAPEDDGPNIPDGTEDDDASVESDAMIDAGVMDEADGQAPEEPAEREVLLWRLAHDRVVTMDPPCTPLKYIDVRAKGLNHLVRFFCTNQVALIWVFSGHVDENPELMDYPEEHGPANWIGEPVIDYSVQSRPTFLLMGVGEENELRMWRMDADRLQQAPVPETLQAMSAEDRALPFRPALTEATVPARIRDGRSIETWRALTGWQAAPATRWPLHATLSPHEDVALSITELLDPSDPQVDRFTQTYGVHAHSLESDETNWGRLQELQRSSFRQRSFKGASLGQWRGSAGRPNLWWALPGSGGAPTTLRAKRMVCEPALSP